MFTHIYFTSQQYPHADCPSVFRCERLEKKYRNIFLPFIQWINASIYLLTTRVVFSDQIANNSNFSLYTICYQKQATFKDETHHLKQCSAALLIDTSTEYHLLSARLL